MNFQMAKALRFAFLMPRWQGNIVDHANDLFVSQITESEPNTQVDPSDVLGVFELPLLAQRLATTERYDEIIQQHW
jgi:6,7-dimethyl-8-ribityllumazine synthase